MSEQTLMDTGAVVGIRESRATDHAAILSLYPEAFPDEDLVPLVSDLLDEESRALSLVAVTETGVVGHGAFTDCKVDGWNGKAALLGPLAVAPSSQRQGVGSRIVQAGLQRLREHNVGLVLVLGDPAYYSRFGFEREDGVAPPYPIPAAWANAWQSRVLDPALAAPGGGLRVPSPWRHQSLWAP